MITVEWLVGRTTLQKDRLAKAITQACVDVAGIEKDQVWIVFRDVPRCDWAMGGQLLGNSGSGRVAK